MMAFDGWHGESHHPATDWSWQFGDEEDPQSPWTNRESYPSPAASVADHAWFGKGARQPASLQSPLTAVRTSVASLRTPPKLQQGMAWFDYAKLVKHWSIVAEVDVENKGTLLQLSLEGTYEIYRDFLGESRLTGQDGTAYFLKTLDHTSQKAVSKRSCTGSCF